MAKSTQGLEHIMWYTIIHPWSTFNTLMQRQISTISQTFSNIFSWIEMYEFCLRFHWSLFLRYESTIFQHWFRQWFGADQATRHYLNQSWLVYWCIYASSGLNELMVNTNWGLDGYWHPTVSFTCFSKALSWINYLDKRGLWTVQLLLLNIKGKIEQSFKISAIVSSLVNLISMQNIWILVLLIYCQTSDISNNLDNTIVDHSDVVWASPVSVTPTTTSFST